MALREAPPGGSGGSPYTHFAHVKTAKGQKWNAYVAGPIKWFVCHEGKRTKPCLCVISDNKLTCPMCDAQVPVRTMGYAPLYRQDDGKPVFALVYDGAREQLDSLKLHERVLVGRGPDNNDTIYILKALSHEPVYQTRLPERMRPANLTMTLLRVWGIPILSRWYADTERVTVPAPKPKPAEPDPVSEKIRNGERVTLNDYIGTALGAVADRVDRVKANEEFVRAAKSPSKNGKH